VHVAVLHEQLEDFTGLVGKDVIRDDDGCASPGEGGEDAEGIELLVARGMTKSSRTGAWLAPCAERRVGEDDVKR
jgi:hypothetical protein